MVHGFVEPHASKEREGAKVGREGIDGLVEIVPEGEVEEGEGEVVDGLVEAVDESEVGDGGREVVHI